ncbi:MAG: hypothetical protein WBS24_04040 [Terriglobales bacterium]
MRKIFFLPTMLFSLFVLAMCLATATTSSAQIRISVGFGPPALPVYEQPLCPGDGYIWTPGYWAWDGDISDYYWVPGTWILAPEVGFLWTPPYWGWDNGGWLFYDGYWGPHVGFYGGINYGFGYFGFGFDGGRWDNGHFFYNRAVMNVNVENIHNVYEEKVTNVTVNHVSYNGGPGGVDAHPRPEDEAAARDHHIGPVAAQTQHLNAARGNPELRASANHGKPPIAATDKPGEFSGRGVTPAREAGGEYHAPANRGGANESAAHGAVHPNDLAPIERTAPNTGNAKTDKQYQKQQDKLIAQQTKERQKLQQQQDKEHLQLDKQKADDAKKQQVEQRHQQQTDQMVQRHTEQRQQLQQKFSAPRGGGGRK